MPYAKVSDNGRSVELDLHGVGVSRAIHLFDAAIKIASRRGRSTIKIIHGSSTSDVSHEASTIKLRLRDQIESGRYDDLIVSRYFSDGHLLLSLAPGGSDPSPISIFDIDK